MSADRSSGIRLPGVSTLVFGEFLVDPSPAVMAPPDLAGQQASSDRSPGHEDVPEMPDLGPGGLWAQAQYSKSLSAFSEHRAFSPAKPSRGTGSLDGWSAGGVSSTRTIAHVDRAAVFPMQNSLKRTIFPLTILMVAGGANMAAATPLTPFRHEGQALRGFARLPIRVHLGWRRQGLGSATAALARHAAAVWTSRIVSAATGRT